MFFKMKPPNSLTIIYNSLIELGEGRDGQTRVRRQSLQVDRTRTSSTGK
jgi:hypothetical protein